MWTDATNAARRGTSSRLLTARAPRRFTACVWSPGQRIGPSCPPLWIEGSKHSACAEPRTGFAAATCWKSQRRSVNCAHKRERKKGRQPLGLNAPSRGALLMFGCLGRRGTLCVYGCLASTGWFAFTFAPSINFFLRLVSLLAEVLWRKFCHHLLACDAKCVKYTT